MLGRRARTNLINFGLFQAGWFVCVLGAAAGHPWSATAAGIFLVLVHLALVRHPVQEVLLLGTSLLLGVIVDTLHIRTGVLLFSHRQLSTRAFRQRGYSSSGSCSP